VHKLDTLAIQGSLTLFAAVSHPELARVEIDGKGSFDVFEGREALREAPSWMRGAVRRHGHLMVLHEPNGFVTNGLDVALNRLTAQAGVGGIASMVVAKSSTAVAASDTSILGGSTSCNFSGTSQNAVSKALASPAFPAASSGATTGGMTFTEADVNASASATFWPINRVGLSNSAAGSQVGLIDVIGNTASQANPYSRTFSIDFSGSTSFTINPQITLTGIRRSTDFPVL
jgi:hypothetical protein